MLALAAGLAAAVAGPLAAAQETARGAGARLWTGGLERPASVPDDAELERRGAVISLIDINVGEVFDVSEAVESHRLNRWANHLHVPTRERVIRRQLVFHVGDPYSRRLLDESERLLRSDRYLYDVRILPVAYHDNEVEVAVVTRDVWTFSGGFDYGHKGGASSTRFDVHDKNVLGTGKEVALQRGATVDRVSTVVRYRDPSLASWHGLLEVAYADNSDGSRTHVLFDRPFYSLDTRRAAAATAVRDDRVEHRYLRGEVIDQYRHRQDFLDLSAGLSRGLRGDHAHRWRLGVTYERDLFSPAAGLDAPVDQPADRRLLYPWVGYEYVEDSYARAANYDQIQRTEDLYLGLHVTARLGVSPSFLSGGRDELVFQSDLLNVWPLAGGDLFELAAATGGRWGSAGLADFRLSGAARYYRHTFGPHLLFVSLSGETASHLELGERLLLGGQSGLRGYPLRYQAGDRRVLLTVEGRFFTPWQPLHLAHVGAAAFFDVGRAWYAGAPADPGDRGAGLLSDVGFGLRLSPSRTAHHAVVHLDVAFPLGGDPSISGVQWLVSTQESF